MSKIPMWKNNRPCKPLRRQYRPHPGGLEASARNLPWLPPQFLTQESWNLGSLEVMIEDTGFCLFPFLVRALVFLCECLETRVKLDLTYLANVHLDQMEDLNMKLGLWFGQCELGADDPAGGLGRRSSGKTLNEMGRNLRSKVKRSP